MIQVSIPEKPTRNFIPDNIDFSKWENMQPYFEELLKKEINSTDDLMQWLKDWSELDAAVDENNRWIYVRTTTDTSDEKAKADLVNLFGNIYPHTSALSNEIQRKFIDCKFTVQLDSVLFETTLRRIRKSIEIFREENIPLNSELSLLQNKYNDIIGSQSIIHNGTEMTLQQAQIFLKDNDRNLRKEVYDKLTERRLQDAEALDIMLSDLIQLRHKVALNAGFANYRDYRFAELGRFDYTPEDCYLFHQSVSEVVVPLMNKRLEEKRMKLGVETLRPWDSDVDASGKQPLKPFNTTEELIGKTIKCFSQLDEYFAGCLTVMDKMNYLDLESRMHKGPGGYNMTMPEIGVPFIFMNSTNSEHDVVTMVHEGGHAVHSFLAHELPLSLFKETTPEIAEVASMAMELMSMEQWNIFYENADDLKRAKRNHLNHIIGLLGRTCMGDAFQHWMYLNPNHSVEERRNKWVELNLKFGGELYDMTGYEKASETSYQKILHFYEVPFYYIEYAFAQLGALGVWKNFKADKNKAIANYKNALKLGYTKSIPEFYNTADVQFDFSKEHIEDLVTLLGKDLEMLKD